MVLQAYSLLVNLKHKNENLKRRKKKKKKKLKQSVIKINQIAKIKDPQKGEAAWPFV